MSDQSEAQPEAETPPETPPAETPPAAPPPVEGDEKDSFEDFMNDEADDLDEPAPVAEEEEKPDAQEPAEKPPEESPAQPVEPTPQVTEEPTPEQPQEPSPEPATPQQPETPAPSPEELQAALAKQAAETEQLLATSYYNLSEEQLKELDEAPEQAIPKMLARAHMSTLTAALNHFYQEFPRLFSSVQTQVRAEEQNEGDFWKTWPQLDREKHRETALQFGAAYRQVHPSASKEEFIRNVGAQIMVALGIADSRETPQAVPQAAPFTPVASSPPTTGKPQRPKNPITQFDEEVFEKDDLDVG